jgi:predicted transglutaminase-like cysteine proteinase
MYFGRNRRFCLVLLLLLIISCHTSLSKAELTTTKTQYFHVRQEHFRKNGVLVSQPHFLDQQLLTLFSHQSITDINDYARWLKYNVAYSKDLGQDRWTPPVETLKNKKGDCEDFAFLTSSALHVLGYETHILALTTTERAHAICAFKYKETYFWFDNEKLKKTSTKTLNDLAKLLMRRYKYSRTLEFNPKTSGWRLLQRKT